MVAVATTATSDAIRHPGLFRATRLGRRIQVVGAGPQPPGSGCSEARLTPGLPSKSQRCAALRARLSIYTQCIRTNEKPVGTTAGKLLIPLVRERRYPPHFESPQFRHVMQSSIMTTAAVLHFPHSRQISTSVERVGFEPACREFPTIRFRARTTGAMQCALKELDEFRDHIGGGREHDAELLDVAAPSGSLVLRETYPLFSRMTRGSLKTNMMSSEYAGRTIYIRRYLWVRQQFICAISCHKNRSHVLLSGAARVL